MENDEEWFEFEREVTLNGEFEVSDGMVRVRCVYGEKSSRIGGLPAGHVAEMLLSEMARDPSSADEPYWERIDGEMSPKLTPDWQPNDGEIPPELMPDGPEGDDLILTPDEPGPDHPVL